MLTLYYKDGREIIEESTRCGNSGCLGEPWCSAWGICSSLDSSKHAKVMEFSNLRQEDQSVSLVNKSILAKPVPQNIHILPQLLLHIFKTSLIPRIAPLS